jgi:hypothetical protein
MGCSSEVEAIAARKSLCKIKDNFKHKIGKIGCSSSKVIRQSHLMAATGIFSIKGVDMKALFLSEMSVSKLPGKVQFEDVLPAENRPAFANFLSRGIWPAEVAETQDVISNEQQQSWEEMLIKTPGTDALLQLVENALESLDESHGSYPHFSLQHSTEQDHFDVFPAAEEFLQPNDDSCQRALMLESNKGFPDTGELGPHTTDPYYENHITISELDEIRQEPYSVSLEPIRSERSSEAESVEENLFASPRAILTPLPTQNEQEKLKWEKRASDWSILESNSVAKKYRTLFQDSELTYEQFAEELLVPDTEVVLSDLLVLQPATIKQLMKIVKTLVTK